MRTKTYIKILRHISLYIGLYILTLSSENVKYFGYISTEIFTLKE